MEAINTFDLKRHDDKYKSWPLVSELLLSGNATNKTISGYCLEAQYRCGKDYYLFITSWDCPFEECYEIILTTESLDVVAQDKIGAIYTQTWLEHHEVVAENQLLLHFYNNFKVRVTIETGLILEQKLPNSPYFPYPGSLDLNATPKTSKVSRLWKFW
jgi:hypothetical protein